MAVSKKEKGTVNSTQDSVKNQVQDNKYKRNSLLLARKLEKNLIDLQYELVDNNSLRIISTLQSIVKQLKGTIAKDPRYPHQIVQNKMDEMYRNDPQIKGATVEFVFKEIKYNLKNFNPNAKAIF